VVNDDPQPPEERPPTLAVGPTPVGDALSRLPVWVVVASLDGRHPGENHERARSIAARAAVAPATFVIDHHQAAGLPTAIMGLLERHATAEPSGRFPEVVVLLDPSYPFLDETDVDRVVELLRDDECDSALAAVVHDRGTTQRTIDIGGLYAVRTDAFRRAGTLVVGEPAIHAVAPWRALSDADVTAMDAARTPITDPDRSDPPTTSPGRKLPSDLRAVVFDFDGVMTDDRVLVMEDGREGVLANRRDGMGVEHLEATGVHLAVLSKERNPVVAARCRKLGIECIQGTQDKWPVLRRWLAERGIEAHQLVYLGNDVNDIECLRAAGCGAVVADAHPDAMAAADLVLRHDGGDGAVRELADLIVHERFS
jgi:YrbI family 3-deoxy-D-manno-octulosonate 8-phosphate phosphatase